MSKVSWPLAFVVSVGFVSLSAYFCTKAVTNSAEKITQDTTNEIMTRIEALTNESVAQLADAINTMTPEGLEALNIVLEIVQNAEGSVHHLREAIQLLHERVDNEDVDKILELIDKGGTYYIPQGSQAPYFEGGEPYYHGSPDIYDLDANSLDTIRI